MKYIVTKEDLKGGLECFPIYVIQQMVDYQVEQGNEPNVDVFKNDLCASSSDGGFDWEDTREGWEYWYDRLVLYFY